MEFFLLIASASFVGVLHALAPAHWIPTVLMSKSRSWTWHMTLVGAVTGAISHIAASLGLTLVILFVGSNLVEEENHHIFEEYSAYFLMAFGVVYAIWSFLRHRGCAHHGHHGRVPEARARPLIFLFAINFTPCLAVMPVLAAASAVSAFCLSMSAVAFLVTVLGSTIVAVKIAYTGIRKLDHPIFEHYGETIVGAGIAIAGALLLFAHEWFG